MRRFAFSRPSTRSSQNAFLSIDPEKMSNLRVRPIDTYSSPPASFSPSLGVSLEHDVPDIRAASHRVLVVSYSASTVRAVTAVTLGRRFLKAGRQFVRTTFG